MTAGEDAMKGKMIGAIEAADLLGMSPAWVMRRFRAGLLPGYKLDRAVRFDEDEIRAYKVSRRRGPEVAT
jgi:predicted DNA-binding transcriptional regulator AlpA